MNLAVPLESVQMPLPEAPIQQLVTKGTSGHPEVVTEPSGEGGKTTSPFPATSLAPGGLAALISEGKSCHFPETYAGHKVKPGHSSWGLEPK